MTTTPATTPRRSPGPRAILTASAVLLAVAILGVPVISAALDAPDEIGNPVADTIHFAQIGLLALSVLCFVVGCIALLRGRATR